jgi:hypothetical protein
MTQSSVINFTERKELCVGVMDVTPNSPSTRRCIPQDELDDSSFNIKPSSALIPLTSAQPLILGQLKMLTKINFLLLV